MSHFVREHTACTNKYSEDGIVEMLDFLIDNIFVEFGGRVFQQSVGIPMVPTSRLFLYSYEAEFIQGLLRYNKNKIVQIVKYYFSLYRWSFDIE